MRHAVAQCASTAGDPPLLMWPGALAGTNQQSRHCACLLTPPGLRQALAGRAPLLYLLHHTLTARLPALRPLPSD